MSTEEWRHPCFLSELVRRQRAGTHCTTRSLESAHAGSSSGLSTLMWAPDCSLICLMITPPLHSRSHARHQAPASWAGYFHGGRLSTLGSTTDIDNDKLSARHRKMLQLHDRVYTEGSCAHAGGVLLCLLIVLRLVCLLSIIYGNSAATQQLRFAVVPRSWCKSRQDDWQITGKMTRQGAHLPMMQPAWEWQTSRRVRLPCAPPPPPPGTGSSPSMASWCTRYSPLCRQSRGG